MAKAIVMADPHLHRHGIDSHRLEDGLAVLNCVSAYALENDIKYIFYLGDIFHDRNKIDSITWYYVFKTFWAIRLNGICQYWLVGNHDWVTSFGVHTLEAFKRIWDGVYDETSAASFPGIPRWLVFIPFCHNLAKFKEEIGKALRLSSPWHDGKKPLLFIHQGVSGYKVGSDYVLEQDVKYSDLKPDRFELIIAGHYHKHQQKKKLIYVGSPYQLNFGERDNEPGFLVLDIEKDKVETEFVSLDAAPRFVRIEKDSPRLKGLVKGNFVQVTDEALLKKVKKLKPRKLMFLPSKKKSVMKKRLEVKPSDSLKDVLKAYVGKKAKKSEEKVLASLGMKILEEARLDDS